MYNRAPEHQQKKLYSHGSWWRLGVCLSGFESDKVCIIWGLHKATGYKVDGYD
jgi:hypothetical protein